MYLSVKLIARVFILLLLMGSLKAHATPFGFEVGKTTVNDLNKRFTFSELSQNKFFGWNHWVTNPEQLKEENAMEALFICDEDGVLQAIALWKDNTLFDQEIAKLNKKYKTVKTRTPTVGDKYAEFRDNNLNIIIAELNYKVDSKAFVCYQTPLYDKKYKEGQASSSSRTK